MLTCKCLNIVINNTSSDIEKIDSINLSDTEKNELFFQQEIGKVNLGNITKEQPSLVSTKTVGDWIIHQCLNCRLFTHAIQKDKGASNVLVNLKLLANDNQIQALRNSENYSIAFRIVINRNDIDLNNSVDFPPTRISSDNLAFCNLQQKLNEVLRLETQATEDRIRKYSEQQYLYLDNFKERAKQEHQILTRLILSPKNNENTNRMDINNQHSNDFVEMYNTSSPLSISTHKHVLKPKNNVVNSLSSKLKRDSSRISSKLTNSIRAESFDSEGLFQLEGVMDDTFSSNKTQSDIESDTDDSQGGFDDNGPPRQRAYSTNLAKSLPMNVPTFMSPYSRNAIDIDDDQQAIEDPLDIAASIKAIAKSVHGDAVFGDLPRPRFSSQI